MRCRKNLRKLTSDEKESLKLAFLKLKNAAAFPSTNAAAQGDGAVSRYDDYVWVHHDVMTNGGGHQEPSFLPWHREFLRQLEIDLRAATLLTSKPNPDLTLPYIGIGRKIRALPMPDSPSPPICSAATATPWPRATSAMPPETGV